jgi:hypothetical protein
MLFVGSAAGRAQGQSVRPDFSGEWVAQDPGSGTWSEWFDNVPAPALRPEIVKMNRDDQAKLDAGNVTNTASRRPDCPEGNLPMTMANSGSKTIVVAGDHLEFAGRLIYTDGRPLPNTKAPGFKPSGSGYSVGRWQGDALVVETVGFPSMTCDSRWTLMRVPGGGRAKDTTLLIERYRLRDPETLEVNFTWEDATVYLKPHTYTYTFKKITLPPGDDPPQAPPKRRFLTDDLWSR